MHRRSFIASLGLAAGFAGCAGLSGDTDEEPAETLTPVPVASAAGPVTPRTVSQSDGLQTEVPTCGELGGGYRFEDYPVDDLPGTATRFEDLGCPSFSWADRVVCSHATTPTAEPVTLVASRPAVGYPNPDDSLSFTLVNRSGDDVTLRPGTWSVLAPTGQDWRSVTAGDPACIRTLWDGVVHRWRVGIGHDPAALAADLTGAPVSAPPGRYLFVVPATTEDGTDLALAAPFAVADPDTETPSDPTTARSAETTRG